MNYVGIDPSLRASGIVVLDDYGKIKVSEEVSSRPLGKSPIDEVKRISDLSQKIVDKIEGECVVGIEGMAFMARNTTALTQLSGLNYFIRHKLCVREIPFTIIAPTSLKKFISGKGNINKDLMLLDTYKRYGEYFTSDNVCDAFGLARILYEMHIGNDLPKYQEEVIRNIIIYGGPTTGADQVAEPV